MRGRRIRREYPAQLARWRWRLASWRQASWSTLSVRPMRRSARRPSSTCPTGPRTAQIAQVLQQAGVIRTSGSSAWRAGVPRPQPAGRRVSLRQACIGARRLRSDRARRRLLLSSWWCRKARTCSTSARSRSTWACFRRPISWRRRAIRRSIRDLDPRAPSLEGYLFPSTYRVNRHTTPERLVPHDDGAVSRGMEGAGTGAADAHRVVTLASLVEKEGKLAGGPAEDRAGLREAARDRHEAGLRSHHDLRRAAGQIGIAA